MTRGKNATAAAGRRYQVEHDKQIETYQRKVAELVAENKKLTGTIDRERESHRETVRKLTAQAQEGVSPELMALRAELADIRDKRAGERAAADVENRRVGKFYENAVDYMKANHGMSKVEAIEWVMRMMGEETVIDIGGAAKKYGISPERALALQKARGQR